MMLPERGRLLTSLKESCRHRGQMVRDVEDPAISRLTRR
jgi:hypothetical protein